MDAAFVRLRAPPAWTAAWSLERATQLAPAAEPEETGEAEGRKMCRRCRTEYPNDQAHFPHGASWCTVCCPPDDDSD